MTGVQTCALPIFDEGEGRKWAEGYFRGHFKTIENLHNTKFGNFGLMTLNDAHPIFSEIIKYIKDNHLSEDKGTFIIQIGSSSGMDLKFFYDQFPKLNYISTDINDEIDRKSTRLNSSHKPISYAVFCLKKKT